MDKKWVIKMKKGLLKTLSAVAALIVALPCAVSPVLANSAPKWETGETASGAIVRNEDSVLAVESEKLTFDLVDFPLRYGEDKTEYKSTVTAEYKFVNTSANTVHTSMAFPNLVKESYLKSGQDFSPVITVDGNEVECEVRHTRGRYRDFDDDVKLISDEYYADSFYNPDLLVTKYKVSVNRPADYDKVYLKGEVSINGKVRYIGSMYYYFDFSDSGDTYALDVDDKDKNTFYVLGDASAFECRWRTEVEEYKWGTYNWKQFDVPYTVAYDGETTLKELVLSHRRADSPISELDYYNGVVRGFYDYGNRACDVSGLDFPVDDATCWYLYETEVAPNGSFTNKITAPIFPTIEYGYDPYVYEYEYYLSPAAKWASFGNLEVRINSNYYMLNPPKEFEKCEGGYRAEYSSLPKGELKFRMSTVEKPKSAGGNSTMVFGIVMLVILCIICIVVPLAVFMPFIVKAVKKRCAEKRLDFSSHGD